nr:MAG TPA: hypothetical protein [Caudoviricetes sp.]
MENDFTKYKTLYYLIEKAVQAAREGDALRVRDYMSSIVNWTEERSLMERSRTLLEVLKIVKSEPKNLADELLCNRISLRIENKILNNEYILRQTMADNSLYGGPIRTVYKETEESEKGSQNEGKH